MSVASICIIILTLNEAGRLDSCLDHLPCSYRRVLVDSGSSDDTVEIAKRRGMSIYHNPWPGFAEQRNFSLRIPDIVEPWVLFVDADEHYCPDFFPWAERAIIAADQPEIYDVPSQLSVFGRLLKYAPGYPIYHPRLVRRSTRFVKNHAGHGETALGERRVAPYGYVHHSITSMPEWLEKHVSLASLESSISAPPSTARAALSSLAPRGIVRPLLRFMYHFLIRGGFRDGRVGFLYSLMYTWYEFTIYLVRAGSESPSRPCEGA